MRPLEQLLKWLGFHHRKDPNMGNPNQTIDESPVQDAEDSPAAAPAAAIDAAVNAAIIKFAAEHGIAPPEPQIPVLQALQQVEGTSFAEKLAALAAKGIEEAHLVGETPIVRTLAAIVGELAEKIG